MIIMNKLFYRKRKRTDRSRSLIELKDYRKLPRRFEDPRNESLVRHIAEADPGHFKFTENTAATTGELASVSETHSRRIFWHFVQFIDCSETLIDGLVEIYNRSFQRLSLIPLALY